MTRSDTDPATADGGSRATLTTDSAWQEVDAGSVGEKTIATVTYVEQGDESSTYSFQGVVRYHLEDDGRTLVIDAYAGTGMPIDGIDRGQIDYRNTAPWRTAVRADRTFEADGTLAWSDRFNREAAIGITFRGSVLESGTLAYLASSIRGEAAIDAAASRMVMMDIPALW